MHIECSEQEKRGGPCLCKLLTWVDKKGAEMSRKSGIHREIDLEPVDLSDLNGLGI